MNNSYQHITKVESDCILCDTSNYKILGIRGNREYSGADIKTSPHITTNVVRCNNCGFIYTNPMLDGADKLEKEHYSSGETYKTAAVLDIPSMFNDRVDIVKKYKEKGRLLDIGSGRGEFLTCTKQRGYECYGIEPSKGLSKFSEKENSLNIYNGFLEDYMKTDDQKEFDIITLNHVLEHVDQPHVLIENIFSLLRIDGILFIEVPNTESIFLKIIDLYYKIKGLNWSSRLSPLHPPFHKYGYNKKALLYLLEKYNFQLREVTTLSGRDRGYASKKGVSILEIFLRKTTEKLVNLLGNRELIIVVAQKKS